MERFVLRDETFGGTLYDRRSLRHSFLTKQEIGDGVSLSGEKVGTYEHWKTNTDSVPIDILYSPIRVYFEATKMCNLRCPICFNSSGERGKGEMNTEEIYKILAGMRRDHIFDVRFTGGEFTLLPDAVEILRHAKELGLATSLNTNGVFKNPVLIDELAALNLDQITVSIDGSREHHDLVRGEGNYDRSVGTLRQLHLRGAVLRTNTVLTGINAGDMEEVIRAVGPYVSEMNFFHMRQVGRARDMLGKAITYQELAEFNERAAETVKKYPRINIMFGSFVARENSIRMNQLGLRMGGPDGFTRFNLTPDGSLCAGGYAAYIDPSLKLGNIKDEVYTMLNIWRGSQRLNDFREFSRKLVARCLDCSELGLRCGGTNVEMELVKQNSPGKHNPYCIYD